MSVFVKNIGMAALLAATAVSGVVAAMLPAGAAQAATPTRAPAVTAPAEQPVSTASGTDSTLSGLSVGGTHYSSLAPGFATGTHDYQIITPDDATVTIAPTTTDANATVVVSANATTYPLADGSATVPVTRGRTDVTVTVTSADTSASTDYRVFVWRTEAPVSEILSVSNASASVQGGTRATITMRYGEIPSWPCYRQVKVGGNYADVSGSTFDPATGLTQQVVTLPGSTGRLPGTADLTVINRCWNLWGWYPSGESTSKNAITYADTYHITSAIIPDPVTATSNIILKGTGVVSTADVSYWISDGHGNDIQAYWWGWSGDDNATVYLEYPWGSDAYKTSGPRTFNVGNCPNRWQISPQCTVLYSKAINWQAPAPWDVTFSPRGGGLAGGNKIQLRGRLLVSGDENLTIKVGDKTVPSYTSKYVASNGPGGDWSYNTYVNGYDVVEFEAPPSAAAGPVDITVTTDYGSTVARGQYVYAAKPAITSISPATVANTGGSLITVNGNGFGTTGKPTVIVNGIKSPMVTRISDTKLTAVVPASTSTTGAVDVAVSSAQGGGVSDPMSLNLVAPGTLPTISAITPSSGHASDSITITGTGFGATGTAGVSIDGVWAKVTASSGTSLTVEVPSTDTTGAKDVVVGAVSGSVTRTNGFTMMPDNGITTVSPATVPSYATGDAAKVTLTGAGFGSTGTVKVGTAAAVPYTATGSGTTIGNVVVPTGTAGSLPIVVTPTGSTNPLRASVRVTAPTITYVGSDPHNSSYDPANEDQWNQGNVYNVPTTGGAMVRVEGTGFGSAGVLKVGNTTVTTSSWQDTAITFLNPTGTAGPATITVTPTGSTLSASRDTALRYVTPVARPVIAQVNSVSDLGHNNRNEFHPVDDASDSFTVTGSNLVGTDPSATTITLTDGTDTFTVHPTAASATSLTFAAPRSFRNGGWKQLTVTTDIGSSTMPFAMYYLSVGVSFNVSPYYGSCLRSPVSATGAVTYQPATVAITNTGGLFGDAGTVTVDGVAVNSPTYAAGEVDINMANLASDLSSPWGWKSVVITPTDTSKPAQRVNFLCQVTPSVTTTVNGTTDPLTVPAGTSFTMGYTTSGMIGDNPFTVTAPGGYEYVSASDYSSTGFDHNVHAGVPVAAGDYYIRVSLARATYATEKYYWQSQPSPVHVTITGTPLTITPTSVNGASFTYRGQLEDSTDFRYTATTTPDRITAVTWEYRNATCAGSDSVGWTEGLPKDVAVAATNCGGDGSTLSAWDVRVKSFQMTASGSDRSIYYQATTPSVRVTINPKNVSVSAARADKVYDGTNAAPIGDLTVNGAVDGDTVALTNGSAQGTFTDANAGMNKPVTLGGDLVLAGSAKLDYTLTNPRPTIVGTISKADAVLSLAASPSATLLSSGTPITITPTVRDTRTGHAPADAAGASPVVLTSDTTDVCTVSGATVTVRAAGTCTISGRQAASTNYNAATADSDPSSTTEHVSVTVFPAAQAISVVADDLTVAQGDTITPTAQVTGLFDGDSVAGVDYDYYHGATLLPGAPTDPGTYKVIPKDGTLTAANQLAYSNPTSFRYVAGSLVITPLPPTITRMSPSSGLVTGGTTVTITGTRLDTVRTIQIGTLTIRSTDFQVNQDGTELTFRTPAVSAASAVPVTLTAGTASAEDVFSYLVPDRSPDLNLDLNLKVDTKLVGSAANLSGGGLRPGSTFTLEMHSQVVVLATGTTDGHGNFDQQVVIPGTACVKGGLHQLILTGIAPDGHTVRDTKWIVLDDTCRNRAPVTNHKPTNAVMVNWFLFDYLSATLKPEAKTALNQVVSLLRGSKEIVITGYTQTQNQSAASIRANKILARNRAQAVADYLRARGVRVRITIVGKGPVDPVSRTDQKLNRRVSVAVRF